MGDFDRDEFKRVAADNERKRRAGTHVYHPQKGVIPIAQADKVIGTPDRDGREIKREHFFGNPETGAVKWSSVTQTAPPSATPESD